MEKKQLMNQQRFNDIMSDPKKKLVIGPMKQHGPDAGPKQSKKPRVDGRDAKAVADVQKAHPPTMMHGGMSKGKKASIVAGAAVAGGAAAGAAMHMGMKHKRSIQKKSHEAAAQLGIGGRHHQ